MTAAGVVRVEERARFRCQRCQECFHDASSLVKHKIAHRKADTERAHGLGGVQPGNGRTEGLATDGTKSGVRHPRETLTRKDTNSHLTHTHRDLMRKGDELMREMDRVAVSVATEKESSVSSMGRLHATSRTSVGSLTQRLRWEKETRARRDGIAGWSPTPSPEPSPGTMHRRPAATLATRDLFTAEDEDESPPEKAPSMPSLDTHRPPAPRYGSEVPDETFPSPPTHSPIHRYDDDDTYASSPTDDEEDLEEEYFEGEPIDAGLFLGSKPIALRKAPAQIRREEATARREASRAAALEAAAAQGKPRSEAGSSRPSTVGDENGNKPPPRWQGGTVIRRAKGSRGAFPDHNSDEKDVEKEFEKDVDRPEHWGDPGGKLLRRARDAAVKIERAERVRAEKRLVYVAKHGNRVVTVVGELPGEDAGVTGVKPGHEVDDDDDSDDEDEYNENGTTVRINRLAMYDALLRARDVRVLTERAEAESAARREEEEWRSSHSVSSGDEEVEEPATEEGCIVKGQDDVKVVEKEESADTSVDDTTEAPSAVHETLTPPSTEDAELAEFERLEREVLAEVGAG